MKEKYIMALDQGTTSSRTVIYDHQSNICGMAHREYPLQYPQEGWVEQHAEDIWDSQLASIHQSLKEADVTFEDIAAIGITNQRETTIVWDRHSGKPVYSAIVWQCRRTAAFCDELKAHGTEPMIREHTGLLIDPYFSGTKLKWILDNVEGAREKAKNGDLLFGTVDSWLIWKLSGGKVHVTDYSNASRTMLFNIHTLQWDEEILRLFDIPKCMLPEVKENSGLFATTDPSLFGREIPITGVAGDQQAALFGQLCTKAGQGKMTFGTGGFMLMNTGSKPILSDKGLLTTLGWKIDGKVTYALEGSMFMSGAVVQWLRDELKLIDKSSDTESMALSVPDNGGVYLVPAFVGMGAPYWDPYARASLLGLTRGTNRNHIARAALECQVYQTMDVLAAMNEDMETAATSLKVDGGACANDFMMQFLADITKMEVHRPASVETTSMGAAALAGLAVGFWDSTEDLASCAKSGQVFVPHMDLETRKKLMRQWHRAVAVTRDFKDYETI